MFDADRLDSHVADVTSIGIEPPPEWSALVARHQEYASLGDTMAHRLADAVIDGADDVAMLRALALSEIAATPMDHAAVGHVVRAAVLRQLNDIYRAHARPNYDRVAADFDQLAQKFSAAAHLVDPETDPAQMVSAAEKRRRAWSDAEQLAHQLTDAMARLAAAAALAGAHDVVRGETLIPLVADVTGLHRRRTWECWRTMGGRTGRWGALVALGARIRAADLDQLEPYALPRPMEIKQVPTGLGVRQIQVDPEDDEAAMVAAS